MQGKKPRRVHGQSEAVYYQLRGMGLPVKVREDTPSIEVSSAKDPIIFAALQRLGFTGDATGVVSISPVEAAGGAAERECGPGKAQPAKATAAAEPVSGHAQSPGVVLPQQRQGAAADGIGKARSLRLRCSAPLLTQAPLSRSSGQPEVIGYTRSPTLIPWARRYSPVASQPLPAPATRLATADPHLASGDNPASRPASMAPAASGADASAPNSRRVSFAPSAQEADLNAVAKRRPKPRPSNGRLESISAVAEEPTLSRPSIAKQSSGSASSGRQRSTAAAVHFASPAFSRRTSTGSCGSDGLGEEHATIAPSFVFQRKMSAKEVQEMVDTLSRPKRKAVRVKDRLAHAASTSELIHMQFCHDMAKRLKDFPASSCSKAPAGEDT